MFSTPPVPSASYFIEGFVMTSMRLIELAGIDLMTSEKLRDMAFEGWPLTRIL